MVLPHLEYITTNMGKLQKIHNRGMHIMLQCHPRTHIADMLSNLKWLSIKQRIIFLTAVLVFKIMHSKTQITCLTGWSLSHISTVQGDPPPGIFLYPDHTQIRSLPKPLDSGISYQHPFELSQTSRH